MREVGYEFAYMFKYSERPDTFAQRHMPDDVPDSVKTARLNEIIALQNTLSAESNARDVVRRRIRWWSSIAASAGSGITCGCG